MAKNSAKTPDRGAANARAAKIQAAQKSAGGGANKIVVATVVAIVAIIATVGGVVWSQMSKENDVTGGGNALPAGVSELGEGYPAFQDVNPDATGVPTLDVFEDPQCPACKLFETTYGSTVQQLVAAKQVKLVVHTMTFLDGMLRNDSSVRAANGAFCAADQGKFYDYMSAVYAAQPAKEGTGWTDAQLEALATQVGVADLGTWKSCQSTLQYKAHIDALEVTSEKGGVTGTPTIKINGTVFKLNGNVAEFVTAIQAAKG
jgi:protein-disulfide isomerase